MGAAVFLDIDGTIWDFDGNIPKSVAGTLEKLYKNGHKAFICTGRSRAMVRNEELLSLPLEGIIAACGTHIEIDGKMISEDLLPFEKLSSFIKLLYDEDMPVILEGPIFNWMDPKDFSSDSYIEKVWNELGDCARQISDIKDGDKVNKFSAVITKTCDFEYVKEALKEDMELLIHGSHVFEAIPKGSGKAYGIKKLCSHLGISHKDTYAIGDSINDVDMLSFAAHGIAMGNGTKEAKEAADYVTTPLHDDGIANALLHYGLI